MLPLNLLDYVVVHELVHLVDKSHSKSFWDKVRLLLPNYKDAERELKEYIYIINQV